MVSSTRTRVMATATLITTFLVASTPGNGKVIWSLERGGIQEQPSMLFPRDVSQHKLSLSYLGMLLTVVPGVVLAMAISRCTAEP